MLHDSVDREVKRRRIDKTPLKEAEDPTISARDNSIPVMTLAIVAEYLAADRNYQSLGRLMQTSRSVNLIIAPRLNLFYRPDLDFVWHVWREDEGDIQREAREKQVLARSYDISSIARDPLLLKRLQSQTYTTSFTFTRKRGALVKYLILDHLPSTSSLHKARKPSPKTTPDLSFPNASVLVVGSDATLKLLAGTLQAKYIQALVKPTHVCVDVFQITKEQLGPPQGTPSNPSTSIPFTTEIHRLIKTWALQSITYHDLIDRTEFPSSLPLVRYEIRKAGIPTKKELMEYVNGAIAAHEEKVRADELEQQQPSRAPHMSLAMLMSASSSMAFTPQSRNNVQTGRKKDDGEKADPKPGPVRRWEFIFTNIRTHHIWSILRDGDLECKNGKLVPTADMLVFNMIPDEKEDGYPQISVRFGGEEWISQCLYCGRNTPKVKSYG